MLASPGLRRAALVFSARAVNPVVSLVFSLVMPRILHFVVALYLIFIGVIGLWPNILNGA